MHEVAVGFRPCAGPPGPARAGVDAGCRTGVLPHTTSHSTLPPARPARTPAAGLESCPTLLHIPPFHLHGRRGRRLQDWSPAPHYFTFHPSTCTAGVDAGCRTGVLPHTTSHSTLPPARPAASCPQAPCKSLSQSASRRAAAGSSYLPKAPAVFRLPPAHPLRRASPSSPSSEPRTPGCPTDSLP